MRTPIPLIGGESRAASKFVSSRTLVNCYLESARGTPAIYGGPGYVDRVTLPQGPVRGLHNFGGTLLAVGGNTFYTVTQAGTVTSHGTILGSEPVIMADNGFEAVIVAADASTSYGWDGALTTITDPDLSPLSGVDFLDQYMVGGIKDSGRFQISALADATSWDALDIATAETRPDKIVRVIVDNRDLLLMGEDTIEGWYNSGAADFPFERLQFFIEIGLAGRMAVAPVDNTLAFLAKDKGGGYTVRVIRGGSAIIVSTPAIANTITQWNDPTVAQAFGFSFRNHQFWALRHPDGCLVWDASAPGEDAWHVRRSFGSQTWNIGYAVSIWGGVVLGSAVNGALYTLDQDTHTEAGEALVREIVTEPLGPGSYFTLNEIEAMIEPGVGTLSGQGADPKVFLELSRNSGRTWGARMERRIGGRGDYDRRIVWGGGFGQFRPEGGVLRLGMSDPAPFVIKGAMADYTVDQ